MKRAEAISGNSIQRHDVSGESNGTAAFPTFHQDDVPLYVKVREALRSQIGNLKSGEMIPPEPALCKLFGVSRITLRKAIDELVSENLLIRKQGRGTFRTAPKLIHELNSITSWTEQVMLLGFTPRTAERSIQEIMAPRQIASLLQVESNEPVTIMRRLRSADNEPITQMVNYLPSSLVPNLAGAMADSESLYLVLAKQYGLIASHATDTVTARAATDMESERLRLEPWAPVLSVTRTAYLANGRPFEVSVAVSRSDRFEYKVNLFRGQGSRPAGVA